MENTPTTTTGVNLPAVIQMREQLPALLQTHLPWMQEKHDRADELLESITPIKDDEELEDAIAKLAAVSKVYSAISEKRKQMTEITDAFKDIVMEYERPFNTDAKSKSKYIERRKYVEDYQQKKLDERRKQEADAAKRKELENHKVDLKAKMLENLSSMVVNAVKRVDAGSKEYFDAATLEDFDKKADAYKNNRPKLKQSEYDACFQVTFNFDLIKPDAVALFVDDVKKEQPFEIWNNSLVEALAPILNEWRARIPDLKKQKQDLADAAKKSQEEADALAAKQKAENEQQFNQRQQQLDKVAEDQKAQIQEQANTDKVGNELAAQASTWGMTDAGAVKLVLKFTDPKLIPKALMGIIYHVMAHPDFGGIQKRDGKKKLMVDDKGRPVYIDEVQKWIDFYLKNCNAQVEGTQVFEDSKVTIRS